MIYFLALSYAIATPVSATKITGKFQISGFSFGGKLPGTIYLGEQGQVHLNLMRPAGLSLISFTYTGEDVCLLFDFDNLYYQGKAEEFSALSGGKIEAKHMFHLFAGTEEPITDWKWSHKNGKLKRLHIGESSPVASVRYNQWKQNDFHRINIDIDNSGWNLKGNLNSKEVSSWEFQCQAPEDITPLPLIKMLESIAPKE
jgi:hypothetical protein